MADKLTPKQEAFAWAVGLEGKTYTQAYKDVYDVKPTTLDKTVWRKASDVANNGKVTARIDELKRMKAVEMQRSFHWTMQDAVNELLFVIKKNRNDLLRSDRDGYAAREANNKAILGAVSQLEDLRRENDKYLSDSNRKLRAEADIAEAKAKMLTDDSISVDTTIVIGEKYEDE
ncbi:hypothetical protein ESZ50_04785 [Weissella muntiaci]|uniref:Terminase n=1 Tax=Weissella muntiaci TaxID=2508881 RepID=A0A6C2C7A1_9LACO|nr:hypothetical protein [Weissella muntiaci]TYC49911.1 hypothetical protein ESZ50_04785 [Weissella muntiaci]